jgi:hypothetical protein
VGSLEEEAEPALDGEGPESVLEPGSNRFMLEFINNNMREDLLTRWSVRAVRAPTGPKPRMPDTNYARRVFNN